MRISTLFRIPALSALLLAAAPSFALDPLSKLFEQHFESLTEIQQVGGSCTLAGAPCPASVLVSGATGNALEVKGSGYPLVSFPVTHNGSTHIDPMKGTLVFNYVPLGAPNGDWGSPTPNHKILFHLRDPAGTVSRDNTLRLGVYYSASANKQYLYFRHDGTSGCSDTLPVPPGSLFCQREVSTSSVEPGVIMQWQPNEVHRVIASWDLTAARPYLALFVDGVYSSYTYHSTTIGQTGFNPTEFQVGSMSGGSPARGRIDNLAIYGDVVLDPNDPVPDYIDVTRDDGAWQPHETVHDSSDAPAPLNLAGQPFVFYPSDGFEAIYEGHVPASATDPAKITVHMAKNQRDTAFFNIYAGAADLGTAVAWVSNLTNGANVLDQTRIKVRTVRNWWQAGKRVMKDIIPAYTPELLLHDDNQSIQCTGTAPKPCAGAQFPSDPATIVTYTTVRAHTSRQFAVTLDVPAGTPAGTYTGTITVTTTSLGYKTLPIEVVVHDFELPVLNKLAILYNHSQFDIVNTSDLYVTQAMYAAQLKNMREHGVNGILHYGTSATYPSLAAAEGMWFASYTNEGTSSAATLLNQLAQYGYGPFLYGVDEPDYVRPDWGRNAVPEHLAKSKRIHAAQGEVIVAVSKEWADNLNDSGFFPYTDVLGRTYTFAEAKLDVPNVNVEFTGPITASYFTGLLNGGPRSGYPELYYWQMDREDPRINRFYAGYHLWLTNLDGVFPYVYQKVLNDTYNDFDQASGSERDLNVVYPSLEGGIDTIQWEAFRTGLDDHRLLQQWQLLHDELAMLSTGAAAARKATLEAMLAKYRSTQAFKTVNVAVFNADRATLMAEIDGLLADIDAVTP